jgi:protein-S-isoprenylcysteine O-methyltransferase Ste14
VRHLIDPVFEMIDRQFSTKNGSRFDSPVSRWFDRLGETNRILAVLLQTVLIATSMAVFFLVFTRANFLLSTLFVWIVCFVISVWWFALYDSWRRRSNTGEDDPTDGS